MEIRKNRPSRRLETPSPEKEMHNAQFETPNTGNETLTSNVNFQEGLGDGSSDNQTTEPSFISPEVQVWTQMFEQKSNDRITKMRKEMNYK